MKRTLNGSTVDIPELVCPICGKSFSSTREFASHYRGHYNKGNRGKRKRNDQTV